MWKRRLQQYCYWLTPVMVILLAVVWYFFGPMGLGGQAAYVIISGNSMEPLYHTGDLVILHRQPQAFIGDIFAYHYPEIGTIIHRIVDVQENHYIFQGDNNDWLDGYHPTREELIGKAWVHIPGAGKPLVWLREPINVTLIAALIGGLMMFELKSNPSKSSKRVFFQFKLPEFTPRDEPQTTHETRLFLIFLALFVSVILGLLAFSRPVSLTQNNDIKYNHRLTYDYTAKADPSVYDQPTIQAGEPLFLELNCTLDITIAYAFGAAESFDVSSSYRTLALVSEPNGWKRSLELIPTTPFDEGRFGAQTSLNVCEIQRIIETMTERTGVNRNMYNVSVITEIDLVGEIGGHAYTETISPTLVFGLDPVQLYLQKDSGGDNPLNWQSSGQISRTERVPNTLSFFGLALPVLFVRIVAGIGVLASVAGIIYYSLPIFSKKENPLGKIHARYGSQIIRIQNLPAVKKSQSLIEVQTIDDLARLAQQSETLILETVQENKHKFTVILNQTIYQYTVEVEPESPTTTVQQ